MSSTPTTTVSLLDSFKNAVIHNQDVEAAIETDELPYMQQYEQYIQQDILIILKQVLQKQEQKRAIMNYVYTYILVPECSNEKWLIGLKILKHNKCLHPNAAEVCVPDDRLECMQYVLQHHRPSQHLWAICCSSRAIKCTEWLYQQYRHQHRFIKFEKRDCNFYIRDNLEDFERNVKHNLYFDHMKLRVQDMYKQGQRKAHKSFQSHTNKNNIEQNEDRVSYQKLYKFLQNEQGRMTIYDVLFTYENFLHLSDEFNVLPSGFLPPETIDVDVPTIHSKKQMYVQLILQAVDDPLWRRVFFYNSFMINQCHHDNLKVIMKKKFRQIHVLKRVTYYLCLPYISKDIVRFIINRMYYFVLVFQQ